MKSKDIIRLVLTFCGLSVIFWPFLAVMLVSTDNGSSETTKPWQCNNSCDINLRNSSAISTFEKFSLDSSSALFVHFTAYNVSLMASNHILDPWNLVWVESIDAPFLSLDLGFNVYSFGMLSRKVHHMTVILKEDARRCLWNMNYTCATETLSTAFLRHVTKGRGVLCHAIERDVLQYQCCRESRHSRQVDCGIPALISSDIAAIFKIVVVVAAIALLCFPCLWDNFPEEDSSKTLSCNTQICINPAYQILRLTMKAIRQCIPSNWANFVKNILIGLFIPILYHIYNIQIWYIKEYELPKMFNDSVKKTWQVDPLYLWLLKVGTPTWVYSVWFTLVFYHIGVLFYSTIVHKQEFKENNNFRINWMIPVEYTLNFVRNTYCEEGGLAKWILRFLKILKSPFVFGVCLIWYAFYISPTVRAIYLFQIRFLNRRLVLRARKSFGRFVVLLDFFILSIVYLSMFSCATILSFSLRLISRHIVYVLMGLVSNKDYLPLFTLFFVFGYYVWDCFNYESCKYQKLLEQTFEKCKQQQEGQAEPIIDPPLLFNKKGAPIISTELFQNVIDEILPLSEVYTKMLVKIAIILSFLFLTYFSILVFGKSSLNDYTRALAVFLGGLIPKFVAIFRDNSSQLLEIENSYKIEKIVKDFINSNENSGNGLERNSLPALELSSNESQNDDCATEVTARLPLSRYLSEIDRFPSITKNIRSYQLQND